MKLVRILGACAVLTLAMASMVAAQGTIVGSKHDFSAKGWGTDEICKFCHTPHNAVTGVSNAPLWNHNVTNATYTVYSNAISPTLNAATGQPTGISKLCLSCHDGTVAVDNYTGRTGTAFLNAGNTTYMGTDLANDHPVSFTYDATLATTDGDLADPTTTQSGLGGTIAAKMLNGGKLECSSCHDAHNTYGVSKLLLKTNAASALCLTCHTK